MAHPSYRPIFYLISFILIFSLFLYLGEDVFSLDFVQNHLHELKRIKAENPYTFFSIYVGVFVLMIGLSLPGSIFLTLLAGTLYGGFWGTIIVEFASTLGATFSFLLSRYFLQAFLRDKLKYHYDRINSRFQREGEAYLFSLRIFPLLPLYLSM